MRVSACVFCAPPGIPVQPVSFTIRILVNVRSYIRAHTHIMSAMNQEADKLTLMFGFMLDLTEHREVDEAQKYS